MPDLDGVAVLSEDETELTVFAVNRSFDEEYLLNIDLPDLADLKPVAHIEMAGYGLKDTNSIVSAPVHPTNAASLPETDGRTATARLRPLSWNVLRFKK